MSHDKRSKTSPELPKSSRSRFGNAGSSVKWINPYLAEVDMQWLEGHYDNIHGAILGWLDELTEEFALSSKYDDKSQRWLTSIFYNGTDPAYADLALSCRGATRIDSLYACLYCHFIKLADGWAQGANSPSSRFG